MTKQNIGQKILHFPLTRILIGIVVVAGVFGISMGVQVEVLKALSMANDITELMIATSSTLLAVVAYIYLYKFYEKREITELSTKGMGKDLVLGVSLGVVLQSLVILVIYLMGGYSVLSVNPISYMILPFAMALSSATVEELLLRGILYRITEEKLGSYAALVISALIFGAMHLFNPNSSWIAAIAVAVSGGLLLGAAYIYTKTLWFPIAVHFAWNFTQSAIFGANVSGGNTTKTLLTSEISGAEWLTGGAFGPEASIQATVFCLIAAIILLGLSHQKGNIKTRA